MNTDARVPGEGFTVIARGGEVVDLPSSSACSVSPRPQVMPQFKNVALWFSKPE